MKKTVITNGYSFLCVIRHTSAHITAGAKSAKTNVILTIEETTTQFTTVQTAAQTTENQNTVVENDTNTIKTGAIVSYTTVVTVFLMLTATVSFSTKRKRLLCGSNKYRRSFPINHD
ncbi:MAG: hypothetical protein ACLVD9_09320 [Ruminococcus sp.]|uniref:hypothetical protein n=1 Tax=Ruminococcus sp. TaxID=41978 RepID=UPI00399956B0